MKISLRLCWADSGACDIFIDASGSPFDELSLKLVCSFRQWRSAILSKRQYSEEENRL
jgi:hypothetical protein